MTSETWSVVIGRDESAETLHVQEDALLKSPFFRPFLTTELAEAQLKTISLPDDDVEPVKTYVSWLYSKVASYTETHMMGVPHRQLWRFAYKTCDEAYANDLMDSMIKLYDQDCYMPYLEGLRRDYENGLGEFQVTKFKLATSVYLAETDPDRWKKEATTHDTGITAGEGFKELKKDFGKALVIARANRQKLQDPRKLKGCHFHEHKNGSPCSKADETECKFQHDLLVLDTDHTTACGFLSKKYRQVAGYIRQRRCGGN